MNIDVIQANEAGGPEVLELREVPAPEPGPEEILVQVAYAGVNFIDIYRRSGIYPVDFPDIPGSEGSGVVSAVGPGVTEFGPGDRVAWSEGVPSYASATVLPVAGALPVPEELSLDVAAALPTQAMTAHYLCHDSYPVRASDTVVVTGAAGGVGRLLTQLVVARGGRVIGTVGSAAKVEIARAAGAMEVLVLGEMDDISEQLPQRVRELTSGEGAHAVYDGIGQATFDGSLASLRLRGTMVIFGGASGQVPPFDVQRLNAGGSLFLTRPSLKAHTATREELLRRWAFVSEAAARGDLDVLIGQRFTLRDAADAHRALEAGATTGKVLLEVTPRS